ncbi:hypothetical protein B0H19DRAFT_1185380 [Mycena capillaripes]|nr:hypothetical protein B0H19DRAFT_1185380 [Mycena capillaripes]
MPRIGTTPMRRAKRDSQQRTSLGGRTNATPISTASESISAPVKLEPGPTAIPAPPTTPKTWRHPDELLFIRTAGKTWDDMTIVRFLRANVLSIPPRTTSTIEPWVLVRCADGTEVALPRAYRVPLLWVVKFLWMSVALVLKWDEWEEKKLDLLHVARLISTLIGGARAAIDNGGIERGWRCAAFDRALRRYWHRWLVMRDEFVRDFWREFEEEEYESDVLKLGWGQWVLKGHKGFALTKEEVASGISAAEFMRGFVVDEEHGTFEWVDDTPTPPLQMYTQLPVPAETQLPVPVEAQLLVPEPSIQLPTPAASTTQTTRKRKSSTPTGRSQPPKRVSFSHVDVADSVTVKLNKAAPVRGSVTLAELVSRIPMAGRHRSFGSAPTTPVDIGSSSRSRVVQIRAVDITPRNTETTQTTRNSSMPIASPVDAEHMAVDTVPLEPIAPRRTLVEASMSPSPSMDVYMHGAPPEPQSPAPIRGVSQPQQTEVPVKQGCAPFRGHPTDVFKQLLRGKAGRAGSEAEGGKQPDEERFNSVGANELEEKEKADGSMQEDEEESGSENKGEVEMEEKAEAEAEKSDGDNMQGVEMQSVLDDDLDLGEDLQLLYPESSPVRTRALESRTIHRASPTPSHSSSESSSSRPPSPPAPPLSSARFSSPTASPPANKLFVQAPTVKLAPMKAYQPAPPSASYELASTSGSYHLTVPAATSTALQLSPRRALAELAAEPNLLARLTQSWGELRAEVSALRAEMRAAPGTVAQLEARVRRLEDGASPMLSLPNPSSSQPSLHSDAAQRWHPLQHLIEDTEMDVDALSPPAAVVDGARATRYAASDEGEPLPPRSRKFGSTARLAVG